METDSLNDMVIMNMIIAQVEEDPNLSMLPDEFKKEAIKISFNNYKQKTYQIDIEHYVSNQNKRQRSIEVMEEEE